MNVIKKMMAAVALTAVSAGVYAQNYPSRPITFVVPFAAGGPTDMLGRTLADKLSQVLGERVIVDNRPGAGGSVAAQSVIKAEPDGYTIMMITLGMQAINLFCLAKLVMTH